VRLRVDLEESHEIVDLFVHEPGRKLIVGSTSGHGFIVPEDEVLASTRKGKQVLNVDADAEARVCVPVPPGADMCATIGENRRMLVFPLDEVNEMTRGKGIILQRFKDGGLSDIRPFVKKAGLTWLDSAGRTFTLEGSELKEWIGQRAQAGRAAPKGFPRSNRFGPAF
jgi:topoisomerase-4 subunit A